MNEKSFDIEKDVMNIDEKKLPQILSNRIQVLEKTNKAYESAQKKEMVARNKVSRALANADVLIANAKRNGNNKAEVHSFLGKEWTSKGDEIETIKKNLQEMIEHGIDSAKAQKDLVEVQSALADSQTAILNVQETQMAYQRQIADATKFLYGLSAYNMAASQSVLINLEAILSGASKEKLGEMAKEQLLLAMDQIKNQENIVTRLQQHEEQFENMDSELAAQQKQREKNHKKNLEQDVRIERVERRGKELELREEKRDKLIYEGKAHDEKQDQKLIAHDEKDKEHDRLLMKGEEHDKEQDQRLANHEKKDKEHDRLLQEGEKHDKEQDLRLDDHEAKDREHDNEIEALNYKITELYNKLEKNIKVLSELELDNEKLKEQKADVQKLHYLYGGFAILFILIVVQYFV